MSSSDIASLKFASEQITIYFGWFLLTTGLIGNSLNIIVFMTLKTFRQTSCALYLTAASVINIVQLLVSFLSRILISGYGIDLTKTSVILCKTRAFISNTAALIWLTFVCLAVINQFAAVTTRWHYFCNRHLTRYILLAVTLVWCLHGIPYLIFYNIYTASATGLPICKNIDSYFAIYIIRVQLPVLLCCLPLSVQIVFGALIWINLHSEMGRRAPIVRLRRDKQLTAMVLMECLADVVCRMPYIVFNMYLASIQISDSLTQARTDLISYITSVCYYSSSTTSFIIYCCASSRFRKQLIYVVSRIYLKHWRDEINRRLNNQVAPQPMVGERIQSLVIESAM